jgi:hypothetical protein
MLRDWTADLRTRALRLRRMRGLVTEAVRLLRADRRRRIDAVIDYFGDSPRRRRTATYAQSPRHVARG